MSNKVVCETTIDFINSIESGAKLSLLDNDYKLQGIYLDYDKNVFYREANSEGTDRELVIRRIENLSIQGIKEKTRIITNHMYADVLVFEQCKNIEISSVILGHFPEYGGCTGGVLKFVDCENVRIKDVVCVGCGVEGIAAKDCNNISVIGTTITGCSQELVLLDDVQDASFENCIFVDNDTENITIRHSYNVLFTKCLGKSNRREAYFDKSYAVDISNSSELVRFVDCEFELSEGTTLFAR